MPGRPRPRPSPAAPRSARPREVPVAAGELVPAGEPEIDEALTLSSRATGLNFTVYLGDLGEDTRAAAESLHAGTGPRAADTALIAVSPGQRRVEIVTGDESARRLPDRACNLAVMSMVA